MRRLGVLVLCLGLLAGLAGAFLALRLLGAPDGLPGPAEEAGAAAGLRAQHVLAQLALRETGLVKDRGPLVLTEEEVSALLTRHVSVGALPLHPVRVTLAPARARVAGRTRLGPLLRLAGAGASWTAWLPDLEVWMGGEGRLEVAGGWARLELERAWVGRQPVPVAWLRRALGLPPGWPAPLRLPRQVSHVEVGAGRLTIHTRAAAPARPGR
jgi:hypothetical protein